MNENKRFTLKESDIYNRNDVIHDKGIEMPQSTVCDLLNSLNEENVKLQARNKYLAMKIQRERNIHVKEHEKWEEEIQKENEQLKQNIEVILKYCREKGKYAMDMKEIKAHNVLQRIVNDWKGDVE